MGKGLRLGCSVTGLCCRPCTTFSRRERVKGCAWVAVLQGYAAWAEEAACLTSPSLAKLWVQAEAHNI